jgi:endonuclease/exonuclease/phosphatase family metal-dependent hydrolase
MFSLAKLIIKLVLYVAGAAIVFFGGLLAYSTITDYKPEASEKLGIEGKGKQIGADSTYSFLIWNVGYCGLGKEMDFFNDGGESVRADKGLSDKYLAGVTGYLSGCDTIDFIMLQEVDKDSKRSYNVDQEDRFSAALPNYTHSFALNYNCKFVPVPFKLNYQPYGKTYGGLVSYSKYTPISSTRYQYPGGFSWPTNLYMLDRCMEVLTYKLPNGKELLVINTHNTAYDETGEIKKTEMEFLKKFLEGESAKGNYVVIGGDWNQAPPGIDALKFNKNIAPGYTIQSIEADLIPKGWNVAYDPTKPTNRANKTAYVPGETFTTLIDFYLTSANLKVVDVHTVDLGFANSDHQPVYLKVKLK